MIKVSVAPQLKTRLFQRMQRRARNVPKKWVKRVVPEHTVEDKILTCDVCDKEVYVDLTTPFRGGPYVLSENAGYLAYYFCDKKCLRSWLKLGACEP